MPHPRLYDVVILGAGLAGLTLAHSCISLGLKVAVMDASSVGNGASGVPISLINPIAGKQAKLTWQATICLRSIEHRLEKIASLTASSFYTPSGILRPAMDTLTFEKFKKSYQKSFTSESWIHFLDEAEMRARLPELACEGGGYWLEKGGVVDTPAYLKALLQVAQNADVDVLLHQQSIHISQALGIWTIKSPTVGVQTKALVVTSGFRSKEMEYWKWLPVHTIKGQVLHYRSHTYIPWRYGISGEGYLAHLNGYDWVIGSTYEHRYENENPDQMGRETLEKKADLHIASLRKHSTFQQHWASVRLGTPNRLPVIGEHPTLKNLFIFAGMGSKGLLYSSYLAELLAHYLVDPTFTLPIEVSVQRFTSP
jgi:glycine/D-amino acid oxidase-like deaminating enzyme